MERARGHLNGRKDRANGIPKGPSTRVIDRIVIESDGRDISKFIASLKMYLVVGDLLANRSELRVNLFIHYIGERWNPDWWKSPDLQESLKKFSERECRTSEQRNGREHLAGKGRPLLRSDVTLCLAVLVFADPLPLKPGSCGDFLSAHQRIKGVIFAARPHQQRSRDNTRVEWQEPGGREMVEGAFTHEEWQESGGREMVEGAFTHEEWQESGGREMVEGAFTHEEWQESGGREIFEGVHDLGVLHEGPKTAVEGKRIEHQTGISDSCDERGAAVSPYSTRVIDRIVNESDEQDLNRFVDLLREKLEETGILSKRIGSLFPLIPRHFFTVLPHEDPALDFKSALCRFNQARLYGERNKFFLASYPLLRAANGSSSSDEEAVRVLVCEKSDTLRSILRGFQEENCDKLIIKDGPIGLVCTLEGLSDYIYIRLCNSSPSAGEGDEGRAFKNNE